MFSLMYICICNAIRESEIREAAEQGAASVREAFEHLGCQPVCGRCVGCMKDCLSGHGLLVTQAG